MKTDQEKEQENNRRLMPNDAPENITFERYKRICVEVAKVTEVIKVDQNKLHLATYESIPEGTRQQYALLSWISLCMPLICKHVENSDSLAMMERLYGIPTSTLSRHAATCGKLPCCGL